MNHMKWSKKEKSIARAAFENAYKRECKEIIEKLKEKSLRLSEPADIWELHDYLTEVREAIDAKYDYRYSVLIMVFGILLKQQWLEIDDLDGLAADKIDKIKNVAEI